MDRMAAPTKPNARERVLADGELARVWIACEQLGAYGIVVKLLTLTGQRRGEIAAIRSNWINDDRVTLPSWLTKNGREHRFPVASLASRLLAGVIATTSSPLLFPARGHDDQPMNGWGKGKANLDRLSGITDWTLHDLRRTFATGLAALGTPIHVTEKLLNHVSGTHAGIVGIYQRFEFWDEQVAAMQAWETKIHSLLGLELAGGRLAD
jgi:integrase